MFRSFFPAPRLFLTSAVLWLLFAVLVWFTVGGQIRSAISIDRYVAPAICAAAPAAAPGAANSSTDASQPNAANGATASATAAPSANASDKPAAASAAAPATAAPANCVAEDTNFLNGAKVWQYQYILMVALIFCVFWYFYRRNEWYWWSVVTSTIILLAIYFNVQIDAWLNDWYGGFYDLIQQALAKPNSVSIGDYYGKIITVAAILIPNIMALVVLAFVTSHYIFRWRKAMNYYYMRHWQTIRTTEGAAQRVQEDTMRFASTVEDLGTSMFGSLITLAVFLPLLWTLSSHITELPGFGKVPGSLVWVALVSAALGTVLLAVVGIKLPGLNFENQRVEAAYRKELVYGEDDPDRAQPPTARDLFARVQRNYFRLYFHYTYFNVARYAYLQGASFIPYVALGPTIVAAGVTLGLFQQILSAFGQVSGAFQFLASSWTTIIELISIERRLRTFEGHIPRDAELVHSSVDTAPAT